MFLQLFRSILLIFDDFFVKIFIFLTIFGFFWVFGRIVQRRHRDQIPDLLIFKKLKEFSCFLQQNGQNITKKVKTLFFILKK